MSSYAASRPNCNSETFLSFCFVFDSNEEDIKDFQVSRSEMSKNMNLSIHNTPSRRIKLLFRRDKFT